MKKCCGTCVFWEYQPDMTFADDEGYCYKWLQKRQQLDKCSEHDFLNNQVAYRVPKMED